MSRLNGHAWKGTVITTIQSSRKRRKTSGSAPRGTRRLIGRWCGSRSKKIFLWKQRRTWNYCLNVKREQGRKYLVDAVAQRIGDATNDSPADFPCCHFPEFSRGHVRVESGMWSANQIGNFFQRTFNTSRRKKKRKKRNSSRNVCQKDSFN